MEVITEGTSHYLTVEFRDKANVLAAPTGIFYRIDDVLTGTTILADTAIGSASSIEITITPAQNAIINPLNPTEVKRVTVKASYAASEAINDEFEYAIKNLGAVP